MPEFANADAAGMKWSDEIFVMLVSIPYYSKFIAGKSIPDGHLSAQMIISLKLDSKKAVDQFVQAALAEDGRQLPQSEVEAGNGMYYVDLEDPDGHVWEPFWMP